MSQKQGVSRRGFFGGLAAAVGYIGLRPESLWAQARAATERRRSARRPRFTEEEYDAYAKLAANENPYGPYESAMEAMNHAFKYANRYGYPDGNIQEEIAKHHGVDPENIMLGAGSGEILSAVGTTFLQDHKKVIGVEPSFDSVYRRASGLKADAIKLPLLPDYRQDIPMMIRAVKKYYREVGFVYMCNPNNPTGAIVTKDEIRRLVDSIPEDVPILVDEAYHHFVEDPSYATSIPYVLEGRRVIVARTFSKIAGLAGMRLGYGVATPEIIARMRPYVTGSTNALVRWGAAASLRDTAEQAKVKRITLELRKKTTAELENMGFEVIPSETNFFMVDLARPIAPIRDEFRKRGVLVGRDFPPMLNHLRVSVGNAGEMDRFMKAFKEIFPAGNAPSAG
ncbi:MAG: histidinol-phosphate transaminase [Acidobacteriota bacterium]|nr:MAG: histidinol-phosphate transaminase [Acidobacteriota bacterium]